MIIKISDGVAYNILSAIQLQFDMSYIAGNLYECYEDGEDAEDIPIERLRTDSEYAERVALRFRKYLDDSYGSDREWECLKAAVKYVDYYQ